MIWDTLVRDCAFVSSAVAVARGLIVGDRESVAIGVAIAALSALTRLKRPVVRRIGWIGVAALFANQAFWMTTATVSLWFAAPTVLGAVAPVILTVAALTGLLASVARWRDWSQTWVRTVGAVSAVVALWGVVALPVLGEDADTEQPGDIRVATQDVKFVPDVMTARAGDIGLYVTNRDLFWHTLTINQLQVDQFVATSGRHRIQLRNVAAGTYAVVCAVPGHEGAGMTGTLVVS